MERINLGEWWNPFTWFEPSYLEPHAPPPSAAEEIAYYTAKFAPQTIATVTPTVTPTVTSGNLWQQIFGNLWDAIEGPTQTVLDFLVNQKKAEAAIEIAKSQVDVQKTAQAIVAAQERIVMAQTQQQKKAEGILSTETWKKATPYVIPIAAGLAIVTVLLLWRRKK